MNSRLCRWQDGHSNGPALVQFSIATSRAPRQIVLVRSDAAARPAHGVGARERGAAVAAFGDQLPAGYTEVDTPDDRIGHDGVDNRLPANAAVDGDPCGAGATSTSITVSQHPRRRDGARPGLVLPIWPPGRRFSDPVSPPPVWNRIFNLVAGCSARSRKRTATQVLRAHGPGG